MACHRTEFLASGSGALGGLVCEPAGRALDIGCPVELRALDADAVRGRSRNKRRNTASPGARDRGGAVGRQGLRGEKRIVYAEADVVDAFPVLGERAGDVALVIKRLHELDERVSGVEVGEAHARLREIFGVNDPEAKPVAEMPECDLGVPDGDRDVIETADRGTHGPVPRSLFSWPVGRS
jgi:hypothetical protein